MSKQNKSCIFTNREFYTRDIKNPEGRITWYTLQKHLEETYASILKVEFLDETSSCGDWSGLLVQRHGSSVAIIPFSQENMYPGYGFALYTGQEYASVPYRQWREAYEQVKNDYLRNN